MLTNAYLLLNGTADISDHCSKIELVIDVDELDSTVFGTSGYKGVLGGLKSGTLSFTVKGDYAAANIDSIFWPLIGTNVAFLTKAVNATVTTSNPSYAGTIMVKEWKPISGDVGALVEIDVSYPTSGTVTRATA